MLDEITVECLHYIDPGMIYLVQLRIIKGFDHFLWVGCLKCLKHCTNKSAFVKCVYTSSPPLSRFCELTLAISFGAFR